VTGERGRVVDLESDGKVFVVKLADGSLVRWSRKIVNVIERAIPPRGEVRSDEDEREARRLVDECGWSRQAAAEKFGVSTGTLDDRLKRAREENRRIMREGL